jgi:predicted Zn-dependent protease
MHLYEIYADNCVKLGKPEEGIQTLQSLVQRNPAHLSGWLRLAALLLETGQVQQALSTMKELTALHPRYQEGQVTFQKLLKQNAHLHSHPVPSTKNHKCADSAHKQKKLNPV